MACCNKIKIKKLLCFFGWHSYVDTDGLVLNKKTKRKLSRNKEYFVMQQCEVCCKMRTSDKVVSGANTITTTSKYKRESTCDIYLNK